MALRPSGRSGFTLLEMLISLTLLALTFALTLAGLRTVTSRWSDQIGRLEAQDMFLRARDLLQRDVAAMQRIRWMGNRKEALVFVGEPNRLRLVSLTPPFPTKQGLYFLSYFQSSTGGALLRSRYRFHPEVERSQTISPEDSVPVIEGRFAYRFSYAEDKDGVWTWFSTWPYTEVLPDLIRLEVLAGASGRHLIAPIVVRPRIDTEPDCAGSFKKCALKSDHGEPGTPKEEK